MLFRSMQWNNINWGAFSGEDIHERRGRLGSLSSAADSGADLSTYSGSECSHPTMDGDGDTIMSVENEHDFTQRLPNEIALQIFQFLDAKSLTNVELVNRRWQELSRDTSVWRSVFLRQYQRPIMTDPAPIQVGGSGCGRLNRPDRKSTRLNSSHSGESRMPSSA